ncbi:protein [Escherichia coli]|nr:protein [Escherichia coli]
MKRVLFFLLMIFVSFGVIADCEIQAKDHDCFTIFAKGTIFSAFPVLNNKAMWRWYQNEDIGEYYWQTVRIPLYSITDWHRSPISDSHPFDQPGT